MSLAVQIHNSLMFSFIHKNAWQEVVGSSVILRVVRHGNGITMQECSLRMFKTINHNHIMLFICYEYAYML